MSQEPLFSVVIPTRNRAHLLRDAIQSVLGQDFDDYELIVSDNCSRDDTAEVVREVGGERARYVRPPGSLSMPDHWEFALEQARGRYVTYLCDDDAWAPGALSRAAGLLETTDTKLVVMHSGIYHSPDWGDPALRNVVTFSPFTGEVRENESDAVIRWLYGSCRLVMEAPRMLNSFCHRETMLEVRREAGRIFMLCPDYSFAVMMLTGVPSWLYIDEPLHLVGFFPESIGSSQVFNRGEAAQEFEREFKEEKLLARVPLKSKLVSNYITETYLTCREALPALAGYQVDWDQYFISCWNDMLVLEKNGVDVSLDREQFAAALAAQPGGVRERVETVITAGEGEDPLEVWARRHPFRSALRRTINRSPLLANLEAAVRGRKPRGAHPREANRHAYISGADEGFNGILECARRLPDLTRAELARAAHR
jgi:glycosyltransferase involved in cell wall biosynthesis